MLDSSATANRPLVIALEGALVRTCSHDEMVLDTMRIDPLRALRQLSGAEQPDSGAALANVAHWPVRQDLVEYARKHAEAGGHVALVTHGDIALAEALKARFAFISEIIAAPAAGGVSAVLGQRFPMGFAYIGNATQAEDQVGAKNADGQQSGLSGERERSSIPSPAAVFSVLRRSLRLHQWSKNALIFVPLVLGGKAGDPGAWASALLGFIALGCVASATYIVNDLWDLPSDRQHWSKHKRPIASGELGIRTAVQLALAGMVVGFAIAALISAWAVAALAVYVATTLAYSFALKRVPVLDVLVLAGLFTLRLGFGVVLTDVRLSPWLLVFSMFTFGSLSLAKRHIEVSRLAHHGMKQMTGRGWLAGDAPLVLGLGMATAMGGVLIFIMYLIEDAFPKQFYHRPYMLWAFPPLLFLLLGRIWLLCQRDQLSDDPVAFALKDRTCLLLAAVGGIAFLSAIA